MPSQAVPSTPEASEEHYQTLFQSMSEGFALCEAIVDEDDRLVDYLILEINPALQAMLGVGPEVAGQRLSDGPRDHRWLRVCRQVMDTGEPEGFEFHNPATGLWHEIRVSKVGTDRLAQFFFDITERKAAQAHQARLFDELNHRVKNNLAMVASILELQARGAEPRERAGLIKAVGRVQSVAAVHESLYADDHAGEIDFSVYLKRLCTRLSEALLDGDGIRVTVCAERVMISMDHAAPLGMIVNELVTNAIKYAYPAGRGEVRVELQPLDAEALLRIADDGLGLPDDWQRRTDSLGMRVVNALVRQVGGTLKVGTGAGARFEILFAAARSAPVEAA